MSMISSFINWGLGISLSMSAFVLVVWSLNSLKKKMYIQELVDLAKTSIHQKNCSETLSHIKSALALSLDIGPKFIVSVDSLIDTSVNMAKSTYALLGSDYSISELENVLTEIRSLEGQKAKGDVKKKNEERKEELEEKLKQLIEDLPVAQPTEVVANILSKNRYILSRLISGAQFGAIIIPVGNITIWLLSSEQVHWLVFLSLVVAGILSGAIAGAILGLIFGVVTSFSRVQKVLPPQVTESEPTSGLDVHIVNELKEHMEANMDLEEMVEAVSQNSKEDWTEEAFVAMKEILVEKGLVVNTNTSETSPTPLTPI